MPLRRSPTPLRRPWRRARTLHRHWALTVALTGALLSATVLAACAPSASPAGTTATGNAQHPMLIFANAAEQLNAQALYAVNGSDGSIRWHGPAIGVVDVPVVAGDTVYGYADASQVRPGGQSVALDAPSGKLRWQTPGSVVAADTTTAYLFRDHSFYALDPHSGKARWHVAGDSSGTPHRLQLSAGVPYFVGSPGAGQAITALDPATGAVRWRSPATLTNVGLILATAGHTVVAGGGLALYGLDARTGALRWTRQLPGSNPAYVIATMACAAHLLCLGYSDGSAAAVNPDDGSVRWQHAGLPAANPDQPAGQYVFAASDGMLLAAATRHLTMLDASSGAVLWQKDLTFDIMTFSFTSYPFAQGIVCIVPANVWQGPGATRELLGLRASDGTVLWHDSPDSTDSGAILTGGRLYLDTHSAYDAATGKLLWRSTAFRRVLYAVGWPAV